jgi:hypothetical protein
MCDFFLDICTFLISARKVNLGVVAFGGFAGGVLQPVVATLAPKLETPESVVKFIRSGVLGGLLGIAAAGISAYILTDASHTDPVRLLFLSVVSGLAFPAVLAAAVDTKTQQTRKAQLEVQEAADATKATDLDGTAKGADQLQVALVQNPPRSMKSDGQAMIETMAQQAVNNIAQTEVKTGADQRQIVEVLKNVGNVARQTGWDQTKQAVIDQLTILSTSLGDDTAKKAADEAVKRLSEPGSP